MRTHIVGTIGPSSDRRETFQAMVEAGLNTVRVNFSHATHEAYRGYLELIEAVEAATGRRVKILADLQGPRIRVDGVPKEGIPAVVGQELTFVSAAGDRAEGEIGVDGLALEEDVKVGDPILIANGAIETVVTRIDAANHRVVVEVRSDGVIYPRKGLNLPLTAISLPALTEKDRRDVEFLNTVRVDAIALSFVQSAADVESLRSLLRDRSVDIIVKIERQEALRNLDEIIAAADGVMVARGDLGVEIPYAELPVIQKRIIRKCQQALKPAIVATQMLMTMVREPQPTRAEVSDVATAIFDGAHAIMLSDETANGAYPVEAVKVMASVGAAVENYLDR